MGYSLFWAAAWFNKLDWRRIFVAVSSCNAILWSLKVLFHFNGSRFSSLQSVGISSAHGGSWQWFIFERVKANIRSCNIMAEDLHINFFEQIKLYTCMECTLCSPEGHISTYYTAVCCPLNICFNGFKKNVFLNIFLLVIILCKTT